MPPRLATAPVSWGIWEQTIDRPDLVPPETLLETVTAMGYDALETGPPGYLDAEAAAAFGVALVATFLPLRLDDEAGFRQDLRSLEAAAATLLAAGRDPIVLLADAERPERAAVSGQPDGLARTAWRPEQLDRAAERVVRAAARCGQLGLRAAFHQHAASYVESPEETEALLERTPPELGICLDTGHVVVGGGDPVAFLRRHAGRIAHLHLKDVDGGVLARLRRGELDMDEAWREGIFCPLGEGVVPLRELLALPEVRALDAWAVLEQDRIAVRVDDLPAVREVETRNRARVEGWLDRHETLVGR